MRFALPLALALALAACSTNPPPSTGGVDAWEESTARLSQFAPMPEEPPLSQTMGITAEGLSDSALARLLGLRFALPARVAIGILLATPATTTRYYRWYPHWPGASVTLDLTQQLAESTATALGHSPRVARAFALPAFLAGSQPTVATLREAAARAQADLLLLYRPSCRVYERAPVFRTVHYRSVCTVEVVLLDTRLGLVPFQAVTTRANETQRARDDHNAEAAIARSQFTAIIEALGVAAQDAAAFLNTVPASSP